MSGGVIFERVAPTTQTVAGVVSLLEYLNKPHDPLPETIRLPGAMLVLSNKKDAYYVTTPTDCSCPARTYNPGKHCKHMRKYYPEKAAARSMADALDSIRPTCKWAGGYNGPVEVD